MFSITDPGLVDTAVLLLQWPFAYALNRSNVEKFLAPHFSLHSGLETAVGALTSLQSGLPELPSNESAWHAASIFSDSNDQEAPIRTVWPAADALRFNKHTLVLDAPLYESVSTALYRKSAEASRLCSQSDLKVLTQCVWLSAHIALCVLGTARAVSDGANVRFEVANHASQLALRRAWFGVAFDQYARLSDEARLKALETSDRFGLEDVFLFFTKQWRLGIPMADDGQPSGTIFSLLHTVLIPSMKLLAACAHLSRLGRPLERCQADQLNCLHEFDLIERHMRSLPMAHRVCQPGKEGLSRGPLQLVPGLLSLAERLAREKLGDNWHDALGHEMARYLADRIAKIPGVRVIEVELRQHMTTADVPLDVDLFVADERINRVYAVQCKHLENSSAIGLLDWLERFRRPRNDERKGLDKAVQQLENLRQLCIDDNKIKNFLTEEVGLTPSQIDTIRPIVVHNLWNIDFWQNNEGICFYDLHTFCNAINGREGTVGSIGRGGVTLAGQVRDDAVVDMSAPDAVLSAYINDSNPLWGPIAHFDAVGKAQRFTTVGDIVISAEGLGL